mgnify:CR=1 FL=1
MSHNPQPLAEAEVVDQETLEKYDRESRTRDVDQTFLKWPVTIVAVGLSVYHAAFVCEAIRSGINTVPEGQAEAARSIGLGFGASLRHVVMPQALRGAIAPIGSAMIALTKNTTVASAIGAAELAGFMKEAQEMRADLTTPIFLLVALAFVAKGPVTALIMLGVVIAVQQLESHVLQPLLLGRAVRVHPLAVILGIATGIIVGGVIGALVAVPTVAVLNAVGHNLLDPEPEDVDDPADLVESREQGEEIREDVAEDDERSRLES